jgi:hypothetical protein
VVEADPQTVSARPRSPGGQESLDEQRRLHRRVMAGDELALLDVFDRTADLVFCAARLLSGQRTTAEDLTAALFVEFWRAPESFPICDGPFALQMIRRLADCLGREERSSARLTDGTL